MRLIDLGALSGETGRARQFVSPPARAHALVPKVIEQTMTGHHDDDERDESASRDAPRLPIARERRVEPRPERCSLRGRDSVEVAARKFAEAVEDALP